MQGSSTTREQMFARQLSDNISCDAQESFASLQLDDDFGDWAVFDSRVEIATTPPPAKRRSDLCIQSARIEKSVFNFDSDEEERVVPKLPVSMREIRKGPVSKIVLETGRFGDDDDEIGHVISMKSSMKSLGSTKSGSCRPASSRRRLSNESSETPVSYSSRSSFRQPSKSAKSKELERRKYIASKSPNHKQHTLQSAATQSLRQLFMKVLQDPQDGSITQGETSTEESSHDPIPTSTRRAGRRSSAITYSTHEKSEKERSSRSKSNTGRSKKSSRETASKPDSIRSMEELEDLVKSIIIEKPSSTRKNNNRRASCSTNPGGKKDGKRDRTNRRSSVQVPSRHNNESLGSSSSHGHSDSSKRRSSVAATPSRTKDLDHRSSHGKSDRSKRRSSVATTPHKTQKSDRRKSRRSSTTKMIKPSERSGWEDGGIEYSPLEVVKQPSSSRKMKDRKGDGTVHHHRRSFVRKEDKQLDPIIVANDFSLNKSWHSSNNIVDNEFRSPMKATRRRSKSTTNSDLVSPGARRGTRPPSSRRKMSEEPNEESSPDNNISEDDWAAIVFAAESYSMDT